MIRIFLTGYMGAGKTTLGKAFARTLNVPFVDLDWYMEERFHKTVGELFAERGEAGFRELERNMLREVGAFENVVISTGGGAPCFFDNMDFMNHSGKTVFLNVHPDVLFRRLRVAKQQRPILQGKEDEELKEFIDYQGLGERQVSKNHGRFLRAGFVYLDSGATLEELLKDDEEEATEASLNRTLTQ